MAPAVAFYAFLLGLATGWELCWAVAVIAAFVWLLGDHKP